MKKGKVILIGTGFVGMSMAYSMLNRGGVSELVLIDVNKDKSEGEVMDLSHGFPFAPEKMIIKTGNYDECKDAEVVVITAGIAQKPSQTRLELSSVNANIIKDITHNIVNSGFNGVFVVASNPVDLMTYIVLKESGFPKNKVIGSGTVLDTARLRYLIGEYLNISVKNIHAYIIGEHGDSSFVLWNHAYAGCKKIYDIIEDNDHYSFDDLQKIHSSVINAAYEIIDKKKSTYYGIGMSLNRLVRAILDDENSILTVSTFLDGEYNEKDVCIGIPAVINKNGVRELIKLKLSDDEQSKLDNSCNILKQIKNQI